MIGFYTYNREMTGFHTYKRQRNNRLLHIEQTEK